MARDGPFHAEVREHLGGNFTGEGAGTRVGVLCADGEVAPHLLLHGGQVGERGKAHNLSAAVNVCFV